ncbi:MAG: hypothetical protein ACI9HE_000073 [Planctomycetota bacterium]|jgi:uncharacterized protein (TIGR00661 family)
MARILYGVSGEGSGHSSRARVVANYLLSAGHQVTLASYDRGLANLREDFDVIPISGLTIGVVDGEVSYRRTLLENVRRVPEGLRGLQRLRRAWRELQPEVVLTDFEPTCAYLALHHGRPLVSIDNQHRMRYMSLPIPAELESEARRTRAIIRAIVPRPDVSIATTFYFGEVTDERLLAVPPILRDEVRRAPVSDDGRILVYMTKSLDSLLGELEGHTERRFVVYGTQESGTRGHLEFKAPSREGFLADLAACHAVVATAGFTLLTECLHLGKPLYAMPLAGQFEQELNALLLEASGCGMDAGRAGAEGLDRFLDGLASYRGPLAAYDSGEPESLFRAVDEALARVAIA